MKIITHDRRDKENDLLRAVISTAPDGIVVIDRQGIIKLFNPAAERLFGYQSAEAVGHDVRLLMPEPEGALHNGYRETRRRRQIIGAGRELHGRRKDGTVFPVELAVSKISHRKEWAFVGIIRDVTERREAIAELSDARARAESANAAKTEFLSRMSHELRTPMNAISGFAQLLRISNLKTMAREQVVDYLDSIIGPAEHLTNLIDDILDFSQIEVGGLKVSRQEIRLADAINAAIVMTQPMAARLGVSVFDRSVGRSETTFVLADPVRLRQCIVNLLTNAIKYNYRGGRVSIEVAAAGGDDNGTTRLTVEDGGIGIPEEKLRDLFKPFTRVHTGMEHIEGAGIGLAVTKQLIEAMDGRISAESEFGKGSRFHLDIARSTAFSEPLPYQVAIKDVRSQTTDCRHTVLYVEDNPANVHLMESLFSSIPGVDLRIAYSAELGLEMAAVMQLGAIILDINLPGISGFEALERLRACRATADIPVIGLSARATAADIECATRLGFYRYLTKPVDVSELLDTVRSVL